jgi:hypothetical protein
MLFLCYLVTVVMANPIRDEALQIEEVPLRRELLQRRIIEDLADMMNAELALSELNALELQEAALDSAQAENFIEVFDPNNTLKGLKGPTKGELVWRTDVEVDHPDVLAAVPSEDEVQSVLRGTRSDPPPFPPQPGEHPLLLLDDVFIC